MTTKVQHIIWYSCNFDPVHPRLDAEGRSVDDQARRALEEMLIGLARRVREEEALCLPAEITIDLETEHWSSRFVAKVKYNHRTNNEDPTK